MEVRAIGTSVPPHRISQADSAVIARSFADVPEKRFRLFDEIYRRSGVATRHSVVLDASEGPAEDRQSFFGDDSPSTDARMKLYQEHADNLALESAGQALSQSGVDPDEITHLVTVSCTGFHSPGFDINLIKRLPLRPTVERTHVGFMGCQGAMNALRVARGFTQSNPLARVLLCSTELCSIHQYYGWDSEKIVANALFADGSASAVLGGRIGESDAGSLCMVASGSTLIEDSTDAMSWKIANNGFEMTLSSKVPELISATARGWLQNWLSLHGESVESIRSWAVHPGGPRILGAFAESLDLPRSALATSFDTLAQYGNMSSATILFILKSMMESQKPGPLVAVAFGPGLTVEAALFHRSA